MKYVLSLSLSLSFSLDPVSTISGNKIYRPYRTLILRRRIAASAETTEAATFSGILLCNPVRSVKRYAQEFRNTICREQ